MKSETIKVGRKIRVYDDGVSGDRYTVVYMDVLMGYKDSKLRYMSVGMSASPFHPQGIGQHGECAPGKHLGRRIAFAKLPRDCKKVVLRDLKGG